jgi:hypothetical protein
MLQGPESGQYSNLRWAAAGTGPAVQLQVQEQFHVWVHVQVHIQVYIQLHVKV